MTKRIYLFCLLLLLATANNFYAQKKQPVRKAAKPSIVKPIPAKLTPAVKTVVESFEGTLVYRSVEAHSDAILKNSFGQAYNGERTYYVTVKKDLMHVYDEKCALHKIYDIPNNQYIVYSNVTNKGVRYPFDAYCYALMRMYSQDSKFQKITWCKDGSVVYKGDKLVYRKATVGNIKPEDAETIGKTSGTFDVYTSNVIKMPDIVSYFFGGIENPGIIKKIVIDHQNISKYVGHMRSVMAMELVAIDTETPDASCFIVPSGVKLKDNDKLHKNTVAFFDKHLKAMQELGYTQGTSAENMMLSIKDEWQSVKDWEDVQVEMVQYEETKSTSLFSSVVDGLLEVVSSVYNDVEKTKAEQERQRQLSLVRKARQEKSRTLDVDDEINESQSQANIVKKPRKPKPLRYYQDRYDEEIRRLKKEFEHWSNGKNYVRKKSNGQLVFIRLHEVNNHYDTTQMYYMRKIINSHKSSAARIRKDALKKDGWTLAKSIYEDAEFELDGKYYTVDGEMHKLSR